MIINDKYPNLQAILNGTIAGNFSDWILVRRELQDLENDIETKTVSKKYLQAMFNIILKV